MERVAEIVRAPLYPATARDLGTQAATAESNLVAIFENAARWNAVLLLDEADIFLEKRSLNDIERNMLVTLFLRVLDYYQGALFLTTNRVKSFDLAFISRIHSHIRYPDLGEEARLGIWQTFLQSSVGGNGISANEVKLLAKKGLNSREICNAIKMAILLAKHAGESVAFRHVEITIGMPSHS